MGIYKNKSSDVVVFRPFFLAITFLINFQLDIIYNYLPRYIRYELVQIHICVLQIAGIDDNLRNFLQINVRTPKRRRQTTIERPG